MQRAWRSLLERGLSTGLPLIVGEERPSSSSDENAIPAELLAELLYGATGCHDVGLTIRGAYFAASLTIDHLRFDSPLRFEHCTFASGLQATDLRARGVDFADCRFGGLPNGAAESVTFEGSTLGGSISFDRCSLAMQLNISRCEVRGVVRIVATELGVEPVGLLADSLTTTHDVSIEGAGTRLKGGIRLRGAKIGGQLSISDGVTVEATGDGSSVDADGLTTASGVYIEGGGTVLTGGVRLVGANLGGQLNVRSGVHIAAAQDGYSIEASGFTASDVFIEDQGTTLEGGCRLVRATVSGQLSVRGGVSVGAPGGEDGVDVERCSLEADSLTTGGNVVIEGCGTALAGGIRLVGATVGGQLTVRGGVSVGATSKDDSREVSCYSLFADCLITRGHVFVRGSKTTLDGGIRMFDAALGGQLVVADGARVGSTSDGYSLDGIQLAVAGDAYLHGQSTKPDGAGEDAATSLSGGVRLVDVKLGGRLVVDAGVSVGVARNGVSIDGAGLMTTSDVVIQGAGTRLCGGIDLTGADLSGTLSITDGVALCGGRKTESGTRHALNFERARIGHLRLGAFTGPGGITLTNATVDRLDDTAAVWVQTCDPGHEVDPCDLRICRTAEESAVPDRDSERWWTLDGLTLGRISALPEVAARVEWLGSARGGERRSTGGVRRPGFRVWRRRTRGRPESGAARSVWRQVAQALERDGNDDDAVEVLVRMRERHDPTALRVALTPIKQGYAPERALYGLVTVVLATFLLVTVAAHQGRFWADSDIGQYTGYSVPVTIIDSKTCVHWRYPCLRPGLYTLESVVPVIDLDSRRHWTLNTTRNRAGWNDVFAWAIALLRLASWALGGLFLIGLLRNVIEPRLDE